MELLRHVQHWSSCFLLYSEVDLQLFGKGGGYIYKPVCSLLRLYFQPFGPEIGGCSPKTGEKIYGEGRVAPLVPCNPPPLPLHAPHTPLSDELTVSRHLIIEIATKSGFCA